MPTAHPQRDTDAAEAKPPNDIELSSEVADAEPCETIPGSSDPLADSSTRSPAPRRVVADQLNAAQLEVVDHQGSPLLVVAGAGTGKTKTLVGRVEKVLKSGGDPSRILLITFTRRAAAEMLRRIGTSVEGSNTSQIWAGTFHSVANRILRRYGSAADLPDGFTVLDKADSVELFAAVRAEAGFDKHNKRFPKADTIAAIYSRTVNCQMKLELVLQRHFPWCLKYEREVGALFDSYTAKKRSSHTLDFDDLLLFWRVLTDSPVGEALRCMFDHILVDEYQDTNKVQAELIKTMLGPTTELCVVGDDAQAIYGFRAATVENMWEFPNQFPDTRIVTLEQNYRSTAPILEVANALLADYSLKHEDTNPGHNSSHRHFAKTLWSTKTSGIKPKLYTAHDEADQSAFIAQQILSARERGVELRHQAVLFRAGHHSDALELELTSCDIPFVKYGGLKYLESAHIKDLLALLRVLDNPDDELAWRRTLSLLVGVGPATTSRLIDELRINKSNSNGLTRFVSGIGRFSGESIEQAKELREALNDCLMNNLSPVEEIDRLVVFCASVFANRYDNHEHRLADLEHLAMTAAKYSSRSRFLTELTLDPPERTGAYAGPPHLDDDWLTLSTIHSAKGCEWRNVYVIHAADGNIPSDMALGGSDGLAEEMRLLYVALTRAKEELTVTFPLRYHIHRNARDDRHHYAQLSRFLKPLQQHFSVELEQAPAERALSLATLGVAEQVDNRLRSLWS